MKRTITFTIIFLVSTFTLLSQENSQMEYEISAENPFGKYNPKAPKQLQDFQPLIGVCDCKSKSRKPDGSWANPVNMTWKWKYIMNGTAVQDETLKEDGKHSGSIRQYNKDSLRWNVHYYASSNAFSKLPVWNGNKTEAGKIILYRNQKAPNGTEGFYRLTFYDISDKGYKWIGEWTDKAEKTTYPTWKITCIKREE